VNGTEPDDGITGAGTTGAGTTGAGTTSPEEGGQHGGSGAPGCGLSKDENAPSGALLLIGLHVAAHAIDAAHRSQELHGALTWIWVGIATLVVGLALHVHAHSQ
jgi:hypothetical protein